MSHHTAQPSPDLGYHWKWTYTPLIHSSCYATGAVLASLLRLPWLLRLPLALMAGWKFASFLVMRFVVNMNDVGGLPPRAMRGVLARGNGTLLDAGCGTGRLGIAIARMRPGATIVGLDNFSAAYMLGNSPAKTEENYRIAGIANRASVRSADMRHLPFDDRSFDAVASSAAIDHLDREGIRQTLSEVYRVLKPGGHLLLIVAVPNIWLAITAGLRRAHDMTGRDFWRSALAEANLTLEDEGLVRASGWFLARRPPA